MHILWSGKIGGTEEYIVNLVKRLNPEIYDIRLCFLKERGEVFEEVERDGRLKIDFIGINSGYDIVGALRFAVYLLKNRFDIIHSHMRNILSTFVLSAFALTTPKILTHHVSPGDTRFFRKNRFFYLFYGGIFKKVIAISDTVRNFLIDELHYPYPERIVVIHNGIDTERFSYDVFLPSGIQDITGKNKIIGFIGRMVYFKRPDIFVKTANEIVKIDKNYHFVMVGDGNELEGCKRMVIDYAIKDHFTFLGYRRDIPQILKSFNALLFTSKGEGFGIVLIEAMAMGVPVFAVNDGAVPEIIRDRENGILLNTMDPKIIAKEILEVLGNNGLINKIRLNAVNDARNRFSIEVSAKKTEKIYFELLKRYQV
ncbi:MAG: glycosyltransferase family 4 protein [Thermodesulfovibrionia bacterium]